MTTVKDLVWDYANVGGEDTLNVALIPEVGRFTVLDRLTGFGYGTIRDIETGFKDLEGKFWLASGDKDIREHPALTIEEAVGWIKRNANNCVGD